MRGKRKQGPKCRGCGQAGHNRITCPTLKANAQKLAESVAAKIGLDPMMFKFHPDEVKVGKDAVKVVSEWREVEPDDDQPLHQRFPHPEELAATLTAHINGSVGDLPTLLLLTRVLHGSMTLAKRKFIEELDKACPS